VGGGDGSDDCGDDWGDDHDVQLEHPASGLGGSRFESWHPPILILPWIPWR